MRPDHGLPDHPEHVAPPTTILEARELCRERVGLVVPQAPPRVRAQRRSCLASGASRPPPPNPWPCEPDPLASCPVRALALRRTLASSSFLRCLYAVWELLKPTASPQPPARSASPHPRPPSWPGSGAPRTSLLSPLATANTPGARRRQTHPTRKTSGLQTSVCGSVKEDKNRRSAPTPGLADRRLATRSGHARCLAGVEGTPALPDYIRWRRASPPPRVLSRVWQRLLATRRGEGSLFVWG